tara:strand:+ start:85 stop:543 length:459 start_codon:yes stop_codon:yes gene_type:complete
MGKTEIELKIQKLSDSELIKMLENKSNYTEDAIQIAETVLINRGNRKIIDNFKEKQLTEEKEELVKGKQTLSQEYSILNFYKGLAFLMIFAVTGFFIYSLLQFGDMPKTARKMLENTMITLTVSYFITMFSLFCITKMIDFLFDLDKHKSYK